MKVTSVAPTTLKPTDVIRLSDVRSSEYPRSDDHCLAAAYVTRIQLL